MFIKSSVYPRKSTIILREDVNEVSKLYFCSRYTFSKTGDPASPATSGDVIEPCRHTLSVFLLRSRHYFRVDSIVSALFYSTRRLRSQKPLSNNHHFTISRVRSSGPNQNHRSPSTTVDFPTRWLPPNDSFPLRVQWNSCIHVSRIHSRLCLR